MPLLAKCGLDPAFKTLPLTFESVVRENIYERRELAISSHAAIDP
jgi:hypothetical protein